MADFDLAAAPLKATVDGTEKIPVSDGGTATALSVDQVRGYVEDQIGATGGGSTGDPATLGAVKQLFLLRASDLALSLFDMPDGIVDTFADETGVSQTTLASHDAAGGSYTIGATPTAQTLTYSLSAMTAGSVRGYSGRNILPASSITDGGDRVRVTIASGSAATTVLDHVAIVERDGATSSGVEIPTEVLFSGASGVTVAAGDAVTSDWLSFPIDPTKDYLVVVDCNASAGDVYYATSGQPGRYISATASYDTLDMVGPSYSAGYYWCVSQVEIGSTGTLSGEVITGPFTAQAPPTEVHVAAQVTLGSVALNGDFLCEASRDGGTTWSSLPLAITIPQGGLGYAQCEGTLDLSATPDGSTVAVRYQTASGGVVALHGHAVSWKS